MKADENLPTTLREAIVYFSDLQRAFNFFVDLRWPDGVSCPHCHSSEVRFIPSRWVWNCSNKHPRRQFSAKVGTIFEDSPLGLDKWLPAFWMLTAAKNGVSSYEIHRALGVTQKTAWFMMHRIRFAIQEKTILRDKMKGTIEVDESFIGGRARFVHAKVKKQRGLAPKVPVMGLLERGKGKKPSRVVAEVVAHVGHEELMPRVRKYVLKGSRIESDAHAGYLEAAQEYEHKVVDHAETYVKDGVHTNGLENFWCLLKRTIKGTYVSVEPFHLFRYLSEQCFRFNERENEAGDQGRFMSGMTGVIGKRLMYKTLAGLWPDGQSA